MRASARQLRAILKQLQGVLVPGYHKRVMPPRHVQGLTAVAQVEGCDPHQLEAVIPPIRTLEDRIGMAARCRDADALPKVFNAGAVVAEPDGTNVQIMHNGIKVIAGGYYGAWMMDLITRCKGHHEPQEEVVFSEVMKHVAADATMFELGGYWSLYSIWFLKGGKRRRSFVVEPDPQHIEVGRTNARLNDVGPVFIPAFVGPKAVDKDYFVTETSGTVELPCVSVQSLIETYGIDRLDVLHCDAQGIELAILESCAAPSVVKKLSWVIISTHAHQISKDPLTHQRCLATLRHAGAEILAEHDVQESFSGDGLILAKFGGVPTDWRTPRLSYNRYSESLFRNPLYDLAVSTAAPSPAIGGRVGTVTTGCEATAFTSSQYLKTEGGVLAITADCALGRAGDRILLHHDQVMLPHVLAAGGWGLETLTFLDQYLNLERSYAVLDIGANVGLFTRQLATRFANLNHFICVEAEPENFRLLHYNLKRLLGESVAIHNVALSDSDGDVLFYRDQANSGNCSLNDDAMRNSEWDSITVKSVATQRWMMENVQAQRSERLIWKSDTQGYDELIISQTPLVVWNRVDAAIIELWRIKKPDFDKAAFCRRIDLFPNKSIGLGNKTTTAEIMAYLSGDDYQHDDLYLWR